MVFGVCKMRFHLVMSDPSPSFPFGYSIMPVDLSSFRKECFQS